VSKYYKTTIVLKIDTDTVKRAKMVEEKIEELMAELSSPLGDVVWIDSSHRVMEKY